MSDFMPDLLLLFATHCPQQPLNFISYPQMRWPCLDYLREQDELLQAVTRAACSPTRTGGDPHRPTHEQLWSHRGVETVADGPVPTVEMQENLD